MLRFSLHETAGESLKLEPPALLSLTRKGRNQEKLQARFSGSSLLGAADAGVPGPLTLAAGGTTALELRLNSLGGAGEYTGTLRVNTADSLPIDQPFTILLKEWCATPLLLITLGVAASLALRLWMTKIRPQLDREIRLQTLDEQLERLSAAPAVSTPTSWRWSRPCAAGSIRFTRRSPPATTRAPMTPSRTLSRRPVCFRSGSMRAASGRHRGDRRQSRFAT